MSLRLDNIRVEKKIMVFAITKITSSSERAYLDELYRTNYSMLYKLALSIVKEKEPAKDVVTNAMLSLFSLVTKLRMMGEQKRMAYLRKTVRNAAYKYYKANKRESVTLLSLDNDLLFALPTSEAGPDELLIQNEEFSVVRAAIATLPGRDRRLLYLKYAVSLNAQEIAELTGATSAAAVRERLSRARRKVMAQIEERGCAGAGEQEHSGADGAVPGSAISTDY